jgi:hypothetical protein
MSDRPLIDLHAPQLYQQAKKAFTSGDLGEYMVATNELFQPGRRSISAKRHRGLLLQPPYPPPFPELPAAIRAARTVWGNPGTGARCYVVLLRGGPWEGEYALYVGETGKPVDERYQEHKSGYRASRHVRDYGIGLVPVLTAHLPEMARDEAKRIEAALAAALRSAGFVVRGGH